MDDIDKTDIQQQTLLDAAIQRIIQENNKGIPVNTTGKCLTCGDDVPDVRRWCDADCRDMYEG